MSVQGVEKERTRRNIIRMGAIGASAIFASLGTIRRAGAVPAPPPPPMVSALVEPGNAEP